VGPHIDFQGRLNNQGSGNGGTHGDHVLGIVGGAGNFNPVMRGNAPGADLIVYNSYNNISNANADYAALGMRITTNSLGQGCNAGYNNNARTQDQRIVGNYSMMSVHSAGNSGTSSCGGVNGFKNITGGYKAGKNCLATGNLLKNDDLANSSSRGPARDGRIKPDICAVGTSVNSTQPNNTYDNFTGTSMAAPAIAGSLAALWEAYKVNNAGQDPYSAVMKGIVLNTADDLGNPGPDFKFGWGRINARRALEVIENNSFILDTIDNAQTDVHVINVPAGISQVKFMVYWHDEPGAANAAVPLVNDINFTAQAPNTFVFQPWVLDYTPNATALNTVAVRNRDSINNVEQVTVKNPQPGNWNISVNGFDVSSGPQPYVLVYYFEQDNITLTYPNGGEHFNAGTQERVRWDANDNNSPITLEYSSDAGLNWNVISSTIPSDDRSYLWTPPATLATGQMLMRVSRGAQMDVSDTLFSVFEQVVNVVVDTACPNQFHLSWDAVQGATDYTVYQLGTKYMDSVGNSATNDIYLTTGVNITGTFYFAVRANINTNGAKGRRSIAYEKLPGQINCGDDLVNLRTTLPFYEAYACAPLTNVPVTVTVRNQSLTGATISNIPVGFSINGVAIASEVLAGPLLVGDSVVYTFTTGATFPGAGNYNVETYTFYGLDGFNNNDTSSAQMNVVNVSILPAPLSQDFEGVFPPTGWQVFNPDSGIPWQKTFTQSGAVTGNTHAAYMDFFNYTAAAEEDILETPVIDLTSITSALDSVIMTFDVAYAQRNDAADQLEILYSTDCGINWNASTYNKAGAALASVLPFNTIFSPVMVQEWRSERMDLSAFKGQQVLLRFQGTNANGNNLYLDNINIVKTTAFPTGLNDLTNGAFTVFPNPSDGNYILGINSTAPQTIYYAVKSVTGQTIKKSRVQVGAGNTQTALDITELPSGVYFLQLFDGKKSSNIKLIKN
jgi:hypothetical protein